MAEPLNVRILDRDYRLACEPDQRDALLAAVARVDAEMQSIRAQGRVTAADRIAVLAALNIASATPAPAPPPPPVAPAAPPIAVESTPVADPEIQRRMQSINALPDTAFGGQERLF